MRPPSSPAKNPHGELKTPDLKAIDALFQGAGLVRSLRAKSGPGALVRARSLKLDRAASEELSRPAVAPHRRQWRSLAARPRLGKTPLAMARIQYPHGRPQPRLLP